MLDTQTVENNYIEIFPPFLVNSDSVLTTGNLPKFSEDSYKTTNGWWLIPTSEVTLTNICANEITPEENLPLRMTAHTQAVRGDDGDAALTGSTKTHQTHDPINQCIQIPHQQ